jgi:hypothetical protein
VLFGPSSCHVDICDSVNPWCAASPLVGSPELTQELKFGGWDFGAQGQRSQGQLQKLKLILKDNLIIISNSTSLAINTHAWL